VKCLKGAKHENLEDALVKNQTANDKVIKKQAKTIGQQMNVRNSVSKDWYVFCSKK
jgi:hypothetical protein